MFRRLLLASAISVALLPSGTQALGLGSIRTNSALNERFHADIELLSIEAEELDTLRVKLAQKEEFARVNLERHYYLTGLRFKPQVMPDGRPAIRVTSNEPIREPYLDFLIEVNWPQGRSVKEYTVLLDPPVTMDRRPPAIQAPVAQGSAKPAARPTARPVAAIEGAGPPPAYSGEYPLEHGPVRRNETLWSIANSMRVPGATVEQMLMALFNYNPHAFINNDFNMLKAGAVLRIPNQEAIFGLPAQQAHNAYRAGIGLPSAKIASRPNTLPTTPAIPPATYEPVPQLKIEEPSEPTESETGSEVDAMRNELFLAREENETARQGMDELRLRIQELEMQLDTIRGLVDLRDEQIEQLQTTEESGTEQRAAAAAMDVPETLKTAITGQDLVSDVAPDAGVEAMEEPLAGVPEEVAGQETQDGVSEAPTLGGVEPEEGMLTVDPDTLASQPMPEVADDTASGAGAEDAGTTSGYESPEDAATAEAMQGGAEESPAVTPDPEEEVPYDAPEILPFELLQAQLPGEEASAGGGAETEASATAATTLEAPQEPEVGTTGEAQAAGVGQETDWFESVLKNVSSIPVLGTGGVLLLLAGMLIMRRRKASEASLQGGLHTEPNDQDADAASGWSGLVDAGKAPEESYQPSDTQESEFTGFDEDTLETDPVAEADVYLAYGRYREAETLVAEALETEPERNDLQLKLAEIHHAAGNSAEFNTLAQKLKVANLEHKDPEAWSRLQKLVANVQPQDAGSIPAEAALAESKGGETPEADFAAAMPQAEAEPEQAEQSNTDFEFDLDSIPVEEAQGADAMPSAAAGGLDREPSESLDDLGIDFSSLNVMETSAGPELQDAANAVNSEVEIDLAELEDLQDMDLEDLTPEQPDAVPNLQEASENAGAGGNQPSEGSEGLDFAGLEQDASRSDQSEEPPPIDIASFGLEELEPSAESQLSSAESTSSETSLDLMGESQSWDEVSTKLDLAKAYVEMNDAEEARSILTEVVDEGSEAQRDEAQELLAKLA